MKIGKPQDSSNSSSPSNDREYQPTVKTPFHNVFAACWRNAGDFGSQHRVLRTFWEALLPSEDMPASQPTAVLHLRLSYELLEMDHIIAKRPLPDKARQNLEAMREGKVEKMHKDMQGMLSISLSQEREGGEENMAKKAKTSRTGAAHLYLGIFEKQATAQLTDEQICEAIEKANGNKPTAKSVASYRCYYNAGKLQGQKTAPKDKVKAFRPKSDKPAKEKKPMSEATKAKLKAYTAANKKKGLKIKKAAK